MAKGYGLGRLFALVVCTWSGKECVLRAIMPSLPSPAMRWGGVWARSRWSSKVCLSALSLGDILYSLWMLLVTWEAHVLFTEPHHVDSSTSIVHNVIRDMFQL